MDGLACGCRKIMPTITISGSNTGCITGGPEGEGPYVRSAGGTLGGTFAAEMAVGWAKSISLAGISSVSAGSKLTLNVSGVTGLDFATRFGIVASDPSAGTAADAWSAIINYVPCCDQTAIANGSIDFLLNADGLAAFNAAAGGTIHLGLITEGDASATVGDIWTLALVAISAQTLPPNRPRGVPQSWYRGRCFPHRPER